MISMTARITLSMEDDGESCMDFTEISKKSSKFNNILEAAVETAKDFRIANIN